MVCRGAKSQACTVRWLRRLAIFWDGGARHAHTVMRIAPETGHCRLTVEHDALSFPVLPGEGGANGWERRAAGLETCFETGDARRFTEQGALA